MSDNFIAGSAGASSAGQEPAVIWPEDDLDEITAQIADQVEAFLVALREVADEGRPESGIAHLVLGVSQILAAGGRLPVEQRVLVS